MTVPVFLYEPSEAAKRQRFAADAFAQRQGGLQVDEAKTRLRAIRQHSVDNLPALTRRLQDKLPQANVFLASSAAEAAAYIDQVCGPTRVIAVNDSAATVKEVVPLLRHKFTIADSYRDQFPPFQSRFEECWQLPAIDFDVLCSSFGAAYEMNRRRETHLVSSGVRDFVALLGIGAASASDGSLFLLQHARNIADTFCSARKVVLLCGVDKIVASPDEAAFQVKCTAYFGAEARLLNWQSPPRAGPQLEELPLLDSELACRDVTVVLLDNGRFAMARTENNDLLKCINCRACLKGCPTFQYYGGASRWSPKEYLNAYLNGDNPSLDLCLQCGMCRFHCPLSIDLPSLIANARASKRPPISERLFTDMEAIGHAPDLVRSLVNDISANRAFRMFADRTVGLAVDRKLPRFHKRSFIQLSRSSNGERSV